MARRFSGRRRAFPGRRTLPVHPPAWWEEKFSRFPLFDTLEVEEHPLGRDLWLDDTRWLLEQSDPIQTPEPLRKMTLQSIEMLLSDTDHLVSYLTIAARKK
jgi:hypothetical protein